MAPETLVVKDAVAEGRFEGGLTRGDATDAPVGRGAVSEEGK